MSRRLVYLSHELTSVRLAGCEALMLTIFSFLLRMKSNNGSYSLLSENVRECVRMCESDRVL